MARDWSKVDWGEISRPSLFAVPNLEASEQTALHPAQVPVVPQGTPKYPFTMIWPDGVQDRVKSDAELYQAILRREARVLVQYCLSDLGGVLAVPSPKDYHQAEFLPPVVVRWE